MTGTWINALAIKGQTVFAATTGGIFKSISTTPPKITEFILPATATSLTIPINTFTASDNVKVTGYLLTETATTPSATVTGWSETAPTNHTFSGILQDTATARTLYAWTRDAAGNISTSLSGTISISKASASVVLGNMNQSYDGGQKIASVTTTPAGLTVDLTYNGSSAAPTNAGTYAIVGTINDPNYMGTASDTFVIGKANAPVVLGNLAQTYSGTGKTATVTTTPTELTVGITYDGSTIAPTNAGTYAVVGTINDNNFQGIASGSLVIGKGAATVTLGNLSATYDGTAKPASATTNPVGKTATFTYDGSATVPTNVGSYTVVGTINDSNYQGNATGTLVIKDTVAPTLIISALADKAITNNSSLNISGTVNDADSGVKSLTVNGQPATVANNGTFSHAVTLVAGANAITTIATDNANNQTTDTRTIIYAAPILGACGASNGITVPTVPTENICSTGTASAISGSGPWHWTCAGSNSGIDATCTTDIQTYTIVTSVTGGNGTVNCTSPVNYNTNSDCTVSAIGGFQLATFADNMVDKLSSVVGGSYTIANVTANHTIAAAFIDIRKPVVTVFTIPANGSLTVPVSGFTATDNAAVTGYLLTESDTVPAATTVGWSTTQPTSYAFISSGSKTLYAWAKDAVGNISLPVSATVNVTSKAGDSDGDGAVSIAEVQSAINMFLGLKAAEGYVDQDGDGGVSIAEVQKVINSFLGL